MRYLIADRGLRTLYIFIVNEIKLSVKGRIQPSNFRNQYTVIRASDEIQYVPKIVLAIIRSHRQIPQHNIVFYLYFVK